MLIPIGHEEDEVRRWPWVSLSIFVACILVYYLAGLEEERAEERAAERLTEVVEFYVQRPYLEIDKDLEGYASWWQMAYQFQDGLQGIDAMPGLEDISMPVIDDEDVGPIQRQLEQDELDGLTIDWREARDDVPIRKWGLVPRDWQIGDLIASIFIHAGFFHLAGNLLFLWLSGPPLEDVWGRPFFAAFYLAAGVVAGLGWVLRYSDSDVPLIGASGAIAGLMGAFMVRFWSAKIRMFYFIFFFFRIYSGTFSSPAWVMLGLWFVSEAFWAASLDSIAGEWGGVANLVHVGGFAFGAATAAVIRHLKVEEKVFQPKIDVKLGEEENTVVEQSHELRLQGRLEEAFDLLAAELRSNPRNQDAYLALWDVSVKRGRPEDGRAALLGCIRHELRAQEPELAIAHWQELGEHLAVVEIDLELRIRLASAMIELELDDEAAELVVDVDENVALLPVGVRARLARVAALSRSASAPALCEPLLADRAVPEETRQEISELYARAKAQGLRAVEDEGEAVPDDAPLPLADEAPAQRVLQVMPAIPRQLTGEKVSVDVAGQGSRLLPLKNVQAVAAARIDEDAAEVYVVVDLLVDSLFSDKEKIRTVRFRSNEFDARDLVSSIDDPHQALLAFIDNLLAVSGASPIPDADSVKGQPFYGFGSLPEYENIVFGFTAG